MRFEGDHHMELTLPIETGQPTEKRLNVFER